MKRLIVFITGILLCILWFLFVTPGETSHGHFSYSLPITPSLVEIWILGWVLIWIVAYFLIREKRK